MGAAYQKLRNPRIPLGLFNLSSLDALRGRRTALCCTRPALLVIDVQRLFADPRSPAYLPALREALPAMLALIGLFRDLKAPLLFSRHAHASDDPGGVLGHFFPRLLRQKDPLSALLPEIAQLARRDEILLKARHDCFADGLPDAFREADCVFLAGLQTPLCVLASALGAARAGLVPVVVAEACAAREESAQAAALRTLAAGHAHVWSFAETRAFLRENGEWNLRK